MEKLTISTNFALWKFKIRNIIQGKSLLPVLEKTYKEPTDEKGKNDLQVYDARTKAIICNALDDHHLGSVIHCTSANEMWMVLSSMREGTSSSSVFQLRCEFTNFKFKEGQSMTEYLSGLNILTTKLKTANVEITDEEEIAKILSNLPKDFELFKQNFQMTSAQATQQMNSETFVKLLMEVDHSLTKARKSHTGDAFLASKKPVICFNCGKKGHVKSDCRTPKKFSKNSSHRGHGTIICFNCPKQGHFKRECKSPTKIETQEKKIGSERGNVITGR